MRYRSKTLFSGPHSRPHTPLCLARPCPAPLTAYSCHRLASRTCYASLRGGEVAQCNSCRRGCADQVRVFRVPEAFVRSASRVRMEAQGQADLLLLSSMSHRASSRKRVVCPSPVRVFFIRSSAKIVEPSAESAGQCSAPRKACPTRRRDIRFWHAAGNMPSRYARRAPQLRQDQPSACLQAPGRRTSLAGGLNPREDSQRRGASRMWRERSGSYGSA
jgi:hypothetical protein